MGAIGVPGNGETARPTIPDLDSGLALLARLPLAQPRETVDALDAFLDSLLAAPPPAPVYLQLLERTRLPLSFATEELARLYVNKLLPLGDAEDSAFQRTVAVWRKVTRAYAQCAQIDDGDDPEHGLRVALVLHRCIHYTGMVVAEHQRARRELPPGIWLDLHGFYASAEEWGVATRPVADTLDPYGRATHCAAAYATTLLTDLASPYGLSVRDQTLVRRWAGQWSPLVGIVPAKAGEALPTFVVDLMQDAGLKPSADCLRTESVRRLDTSRLALLLTQVRQQLAQHLSPAQTGLGDDCTAGQCKRLLEHLARPWSQAQAMRKFRRHAAAGLAQVAAGFEAMHFLISGQPFSQPDSARAYSRQDFDTLFVFRQMTDPTAQLQIAQERLCPRPDQWEVVNQSANGFRLIRTLAGGRVAHGQLLAVCPADGDRYLLAQITWLMQDRNHGLVAGIASLPGVPQAIAARIQGGACGHGDAYQRAFLLPAVAAVGAGESLVLPAGWFQADRIVELHTDTPRQVRLDHVLQEGHEFERVSFSPVD